MDIDVAVLPILLCGGALVSIMSMVLLMLADPKSLLGQLLLGLFQGGKLIPLLALCGATACFLRLRETGMTLHAMRRESALKDTMLANREETLQHLQTENATMKVDLANKDQTIQRLQIDFATMEGRSVNTVNTRSSRSSSSAVVASERIGDRERAQIPAHAEGAEISAVYQAEGDLCDMGFAVDAVTCALEVFDGDADAALQMLLDEADVA